MMSEQLYTLTTCEVCEGEGCSFCDKIGKRLCILPPCTNHQWVYPAEWWKNDHWVPTDENRFCANPGCGVKASEVEGRDNETQS